MSKEWQYSPDWCEEDMLDGSHCGYVYMFYFTKMRDLYWGKAIMERCKGYKKPNN
jgi:hypothetical protein